MDKNSLNVFLPINENPIVLNFSKCRYIDEVHIVLKEKFGLPDYYGKNRDALWDCLRYLWVDGEKICIEIHGFNSLNDELKEYCSVMLDIFDDIHEQTPNVCFKFIN